MAESIMASAIALTDQPEPSPDTRGVKRRASVESEQEQDGKRQRISPTGKNSPTGSLATEKNGDQYAHAESTPSKDTQSITSNSPVHPREPLRRKSSAVVDDRQRSKRLFGALLGNLNQPSDRASKKRQEIESRRKAELQRQDDERLEDKKQRMEQLAEQRTLQQRRVDAQNMRIRHKNMLNSANFLQTSTEPKLYYRPWDLRPDEEDRIEDQIKEAQAQIDRETESFDSGQRHDRAPNNSAEGDRPQTSGSGERLLDSSGDTDNAIRPGTRPNGQADGQTQDESNPQTIPSRPAEVPESDSTNDQHSKNAKDHDPSTDIGRHEEAEDDGDDVVEDEEDTVIY